MANNYYDATGVLVLDKVTPVINALFASYQLNESYPGKGEAYIAKISEENTPTWNEIFENLKDLASSLSIASSEGDTENIRATLGLLSKHFNAGDDGELTHLIEHHDLDEYEADLEPLFIMATRFDDGHGLKAIKWEGAWHCSRARLFEFSGNGVYLSNSVSVYRDSTQALSLGEDLHSAIRSGNLDQAAEFIQKDVLILLAGIRDEFVRQVVQRHLANRLLQIVSAANGSPMT